ncbi:ATP synthase subunit I [Alkalilimnicola ehrlichii]|nr:ATP synthase subunit I [Alkalilimnicola ehrlichii]
MQPVVSRVAVGQLLVAVISAVIWFIVREAGAAEAAFFGGMIGFVPTTVMALIMFRRRAMGSPKIMVRAFYWGEAVKFVLTVAMFLIAIPLYHANFLPLIVTYVFSLMVSWFALLKGNT